MVAAVLTPAGFSAEPLVKLTSPLDYQVFQRQSPELGVVHVKGRSDYSTDVLEAKITGHSASGELAGNWEPLQADVEGDGFSGDLKVPAGGWYQLTVRARKADGVAAESAVEHVGVGEVFVGAGQSNSTNYGSERQTVKSGLVASFDGKTWRLANDPQPGTQDGSQGGSFWPAFGDALAEKYHIPIGVAVTGCGGTSVREWLPKGIRFTAEPTTGKHVTAIAPGEWESTGELFEGLANRISALGPNGFRAVLWHQGESDAGQLRGGAPADRQITASEYFGFVLKLFDASRRKAGWPVPWFMAQATYHSESDPSDEEFRTAQKSLSDDGIFQAGPDTDLLRGEYRAGVHFNGKGLQAHGKAWAEKVEAYLDRWIADPRLIPETRTSGRSHGD